MLVRRPVLDSPAPGVHGSPWRLSPSSVQGSPAPAAAPAVPVPPVPAAPKHQPPASPADRNRLLAQAGLPQQGPAPAGPASAASATPAASLMRLGLVLRTRIVCLLSYTRFWLAGGPCVNPCGPDHVPNPYFDQEMTVLLYPCSPESNDEELILDNLNGPGLDDRDEDMDADRSTDMFSTTGREVRLGCSGGDRCLILWVCGCRCNRFPGSGAPDPDLLFGRANR